MLFITVTRAPPSWPVWFSFLVSLEPLALLIRRAKDEATLAEGRAE